MIQSYPHVRSMSVTTWRLVRLLGSAALVATGAIHLDLYLTGYSTIATIGALFLVQVISAFILAVAVFASSNRLIAVLGAGFLLSTLVGYLLSLRFSLFGFREVRTTAGIVAGIIEIIGFVVLAAWALRPGVRHTSSVEATAQRQPAFHGRNVVRGARWSAVILAVFASLSLGLQLASSNVASTNSGGPNAIVKVTSIQGVKMLTNKHGFTLYWFVPDSSTKSSCYSTCAAYWPPVLGKPSPAAGIAGSFGTLQRTNGTTQVTYNGHPLYTYIGDSAPGQASGNRVRLNGGLWYEMKVSK
ncbi:MAG TPA: hypothetical protein VMU68_09260 [Acidimicrobiales bacterium]|nr:hypothetical protein [Acidimicrobiales bacterium]